MSGVRTAMTPQGILVTADSMVTLTIAPPADRGGERRRVQIWGDSCEAVVHPEGSAWFSDYLGGSFSLVRMPDDVERQVDPERARKGDLVGFADGFPLLLVGEASLTELNGRLRTPVEVERFRPNLLVSGGEAFAEDSWKRLRIGGLQFRGVKRCSRCSMINIDPMTGAADAEPLRTLAGYRRTDGGVHFGMNLIHDGRGELRVGDTVEPAKDE